MYIFLIKFQMSSDDPHNRMKHKEKIDEDDEEDHVDKMLRKAGCAEAHYKVQECMAETKDWRKCQDLVKAFKDCIDQSKRKNQE